MNAGVCDGMTYLEIKETMPEEYQYVKSLLIHTMLPTLSLPQCLYVHLLFETEWVLWCPSELIFLCAEDLIRDCL
jgi:hypothetical protein